MHPSWPRSIRDQCVTAGVLFFFKQHGEWVDWASLPGNPPPLDTDKFMGRGGEIRSIEQGTPFADDFGYSYIRKVGKKKAGRLLDGREWNEMQEVAGA